ncbi:DNA polymerase V subunit UmuC [Shinella sp. SUS2]|uniref:Y-family DNA polymerase n=1 Tax=unclassified Shinella TaxID=2643062 RepID=UPI000680DC71|nr:MULTISPECIES: Y-family DNA polymerase [unclassified Shinella]KNY13066.1 DNA polymerase V subunit UmuC [Shinella sp. SUS2]KOC71787.1 DNA polymerase V subunit UmuC [Shinella sp. GWS1]
MADLLALVDCNNFYASCERVFQPRLRGRPVVVLSNNDGCVIARSNEAKALGIAMGAPWHLNKDLFQREGVIVRSSNYSLYGDMSARVMQILAEMTPQLEIYSIDEAFLDLAGFEGRAEAHMRQVRQTVLAWTGIPVSVGIAPTKTLAKVANRLAKKRAATGGVLVLADEASQTEALAQLELTDLWGVAGRLAQRLVALGIASPLALRAADPKFVRQHCSVVIERMVLELRGMPCLGLETVAANRQTIMASRSFGRPVEYRRELEEAVASYISRAAEKMRRQDLVTSAVTVFALSNRFKPDERQYSGTHTVHLPVATADTSRLLKAALHGVARIWQPGIRYKKAGVICLDLQPASKAQPGLFHAADGPERQALMSALDELNRRYGRGMVSFAAAGTSQAWSLRSERRSRRYTTRWAELLEVKDGARALSQAAGSPSRGPDPSQHKTP